MKSQTEGKGIKMRSSLMLGVNNDVVRQEDDFYATDPKALELFIGKLKEDGLEINYNVWECACGQGHLSEVLKRHNHNVYSSDLIERGYGDTGIDFLKCDKQIIGDILTNPPFKLAEKFVEKGMELLNYGNRLYLFLKIQFLEGQNRHKLFKKYPPKYVYCYSSRQKCARDGEFEKYTATTQFYAWFIWEKGNKNLPIINWIK
jgi:hypothetical protein